jgi:hypothetical protein
VRVSEQLTIAFADAASQIAGVAITGAGTLLALDGELAAAAPPQLSGAEPAWTLAAAGAYELSLEALADGATLASGAQIWLCRASGHIETRELDGLATLIRTPGGAVTALDRRLSLNFEPAFAVALTASRPRGASAHGEELLEAIVFRGEPPAPSLVEKPRLSTTYDAAGIPRHAGVELWESEEVEFALRLGGEAVSNGELIHPDGARSRVVFLAWHHRGRHALGSYTITTPAA